MNQPVELMMIVLVLTDLLLLGSSRVAGSVRLMAAQGLLLGLLPLLAHHGLGGHALVLAAGSTGLKGLIFPWLLRRALRDTETHREMEPFVGYVASLLIGLAVLGASCWLGARLPLPGPVVSPLALPVGLFTIWVGLFLIVARSQAITQVLGYVVMENGIFTVGVVLVQGQPFLVELGVLLDIFVAVFVMGLLVFHISREFEHMDTDQLDALKDWSS